MPEEWRSWDEHYEVSSLGRVRTWRKQKTLTPRLEPLILKQSPRKGGRYPSVGLWDGGGYRFHNTHVLVCTLWHGPRPHGEEVLHADDDPTNCAASNLRWGTRSENVLDRVRNGGTRLDQAKVMMIRSSREGHSQIAERLGVSPKTVADVRSGRTWSWVSQQVLGVS